MFISTIRLCKLTQDLVLNPVSSSQLRHYRFLGFALAWFFHCSLLKAVEPRVWICGWKAAEVVRRFSKGAYRNVPHICEYRPAQDETEYGSAVTDWRRRLASCEAFFLTHVLTTKGVLKQLPAYVNSEAENWAWLGALRKSWKRKGRWKNKPIVSQSPNNTAYCCEMLQHSMVAASVVSFQML